MNEFLMGAVVMGFVVAALFFFRFWRKTGDVLFLLFCVSFLVQAAARMTFALVANPTEQRPVFYLPRLFAYLLILGGITSKNLKPRPRDERPG